ncbi:class I SAM-dependent methyltransferase [uncultured Brachyspira sp.]|uniref:class I SAM-dependent methyltransferase n=1 Tax=uncultured Brachyspira sp. TaxID=221953 RepID=UPI0026338DE7|nr:class I SAM-dependent methyltransferase [uncultured Brachyspira sp.]
MWKDIWEKKGKNIDCSNLTLSDLISIDGFDSSGKSLEESNWIEYAKHVCVSVNDIKNKKNILEIGCGAGAFLKAMESFLNKESKIYGIDYSQNLINIAKHVFNAENFNCIEAIDIDKLYNNNYFDFIFSNSAFQYFQNKGYAFFLIDKLYNLLQVNGDLVLLDLNNLEKESEYHKIRMSGMTEKEYKEKYSSLNHLFFSKEEIFSYISHLGFKKIIIEEQNIKGYSNNELRFNIFALSKK